MLRDNGAWCRLEAEDRFFVHVGYDQYKYIGSAQPCRHAVALTTASGLFVEPLDASPYDPGGDGPFETRPADTAFWTEVASVSHAPGPVVRLPVNPTRVSPECGRWPTCSTG
jgi:hypothetical protein